MKIKCFPFHYLFFRINKDRFASFDMRANNVRLAVREAEVGRVGGEEY